MTVSCKIDVFLFDCLLVIYSIKLFITLSISKGLVFIPLNSLRSFSFNAVLSEKISLKTALKLKDLKEFEGMKTSPSEIDKVINSLIEYITKRQLNKNTSILQDTVNNLIKK